MAKYYATIAGLPNIGVDDRKDVYKRQGVQRVVVSTIELKLRADSLKVRSPQTVLDAALHRSLRVLHR